MKKILLILALVFTVGAFACSDLPSDLGDKGVVGINGPGGSGLGVVALWGVGGDAENAFKTFSFNDEYLYDDSEKTINSYINGCNDSPKNHGQYVSCVAHNTKDLVRMNLLTNKQRALIIQAAAQSDIGKK